MAKSPAHLPLFESVVGHIRNIELNCSSFQPACSCISNSNTSSTPNTTPTSMPKDTSAPTTATTSNSQTRTPHLANFCTICHQTGHTANKHKQGGDQEGGITDHGKQLALHAYMMDLDVDSGVDGGVSSAESLLPPSAPVVNEDSSTPFAALGTTDFVPSVTSVVNKDVLFDLYRNGVMPSAFSSILKIHLHSLLLPSLISITLFLTPAAPITSSRTIHCSGLITHPLQFLSKRLIVVSWRLLLKETLSFTSNVTINLLSLLSVIVSMHLEHLSTFFQLVLCKSGACVFTSMKM